MLFFLFQLISTISVSISVMEQAAAAGLPDAAPAPPPQLTADEVTTIAIREDEQGFSVTIDGKVISADALPAELQELAQKNPDQKIQIRARRSTPSHQVHDVITACSRAGLNQIIFGAPLPDPNP